MNLYVVCPQDIEISSDIMAGFKQFASTRPGGAVVDMNVLVLTSGFWPSYRTFDCLLPTELLKAQQVWRTLHSTRCSVLCCCNYFRSQTALLLR